MREFETGEMFDVSFIRLYLRTNGHSRREDRRVGAFFSPPKNDKSARSLRWAQFQLENFLRPGDSICQMLGVVFSPRTTCWACEFASHFKA